MILRALVVALACGILASAVPAAAQTPDKGETARPRGDRAKPARPSGARRGEAPAEEGEAKPGAKPAAAKGARGKPAAPAGLQATPVAVFGDWNVFAAGQGRARICYAITQPKARQPASLKRDAAYLFVTVRKAENLPNEVALILGFAARSGAQAAGAAPRAAADPTMTVGTTSYGLVVKDANAWLQNTADEGRAVGEMGRVGKLVVKAVSLRGNASSDEYSLTGFGDAMKRAREECK